MSTMTSMAIPWEFCKGRDERPLGDSRGEPVGVAMPEIDETWECLYHSNGDLGDGFWHWVYPTL